MKNALIRTASLIVIIAVPGIALAAPRNFAELVSLFVSILQSATTVLVAGAIVVYFYGVTAGIWKSSKGDTSELRSYIGWGITILFVMVSIWGILRILQNTLFSGSSGYGGTGGGKAATCDSFGSCTFGE